MVTYRKCQLLFFTFPYLKKRKLKRKSNIQCFSVLLLTVVNLSNFLKDASSLDLFFSPTKSMWRSGYILKAVTLAWLLQVWYTVIPELRYWNKKHIFHTQRKLSLALLSYIYRLILCTESLLPLVFFQKSTLRYFVI